MKKVLMLAHVASMIDLFNKENISILSSLGYHVDVICNFEKGNVTSDYRVQKFRKKLDLNGIGTYHAPIPRSIFSIRELYYSYKIISNLAKENNYLIIHCQSPIGGVLARLACKNERKNGTKIIYMVHGFHFYKGAPLINWILYYPIERICSKFTDCLITINKEDYLLAKDKMNKAKQIRYVPGVGIDIDKINCKAINKDEMRKRFKIPTDSFIIISVGELNRNKNHEVIIKAIASLRNDKIYYIICGKGNLTDSLKKLVRELRIEDKVIFLGYREDVIEINKMSDVFAFPSKREGLSVSLMEAMACGLPVICSRIRGNVDLIDNMLGGIWTEHSDVAGYANAIECIYNDRELGLAFGKYNLKRIKEYDLKSVRALMKDIYEEII